MKNVKLLAARAMRVMAAYQETAIAIATTSRDSYLRLAERLEAEAEGNYVVIKKTDGETLWYRCYSEADVRDAYDRCVRDRHDLRWIRTYEGGKKTREFKFRAAGLYQAVA